MDELNHTELVALARLNDIPGVSRAVPRELLIEALDRLQPLDIRNPVQGLAIKMSNWLKKWWHRLRDTAPKATCPDCPGCSDLQVLACYEVSKGQMEK